MNSKTQNKRIFYRALAGISLYVPCKEEEQGKPELQMMTNEHGECFVPAFYGKRSLKGDYEENTLTYYQMQVDRSRNPILVGVSERDYSGAVSLPEENKEHKAAVFENVVYGAIHKKLLSTLYMPGEGFEGGWADSLFRKLCVGRRLFKGRNLYVSGACLMAREMAEEKHL